MPETGSDLEIRAARPADVGGIFELLLASLGWADDATFRALYAWKHDENPFGASPRWVACDGDRIVGFRSFLRWEFERDGRVLRAVRAVDTATAPEARGRGIFRALTMHGIAALEQEGVDLVFNTPNDRSGPGYLSMGWESVGHVRFRVRPKSVAGLVRWITQRGTTSRWSEPTGIGVPAAEALADAEVVGGLLGSRPPSPQVRTAWTVDALRWRYAGAVPARAVVHPDGPDHGMAFLRVRSRGRARMAILGDVLVPGADPKLRRELVRLAARGADASGIAALGRGVGLRDGFLPAGSKGPLLVTRKVTTDPPTELDDWDLGYGDLELF